MIEQRLAVSSLRAFFISSSRTMSSTIPRGPLAGQFMRGLCKVIAAMSDFELHADPHTIHTLTDVPERGVSTKRAVVCRRGTFTDHARFRGTGRAQYPLDGGATQPLTERVFLSGRGSEVSLFSHQHFLRFHADKNIFTTSVRQLAFGHFTTRVTEAHPAKHSSFFAFSAHFLVPNLEHTHERVPAGLHHT